MLFYAIACYAWWGFAVFFFKAAAHVPPFELLAHRVVWSFVLVGFLLRYRGRWPEALAVFRRPKVVAALAASTAFVALNWFTYLWAVINDQVVQASLGYFINPLVNVLLGFLFLGNPAELPCGPAGEPEPDGGDRLLLDWNGDGGNPDLTDGIGMLAYLFLGQAPHSLGSTCTTIPGCPDRCAP